MMEISLLFFWMLSFYFWKSNNPINLCLLLILSAIVIALVSWSLWSKWMALSLILVFVGGMMVAFLYVSSLAFNQKITTPALSGPLMFFIVLALSLWFKFPVSPPCFTPVFSFNSSMSPLMVVLIIYLLVALFFVVKITESFKGALTQKF